MKLLGGNQGKGVNEVTIWERPIERPGKDKLVGYFYPKNAPGGSTSLTSGAAGSTGRIGRKLTAKNGSKQDSMIKTETSLTSQKLK